MSVTRHATRSPGGVDRLGRRLQVRLGAGPDDDVRTLAPGRLGDLPAQPGPHPGHHHRRAFEQHVSVPPVARFESFAPAGYLPRLTPRQTKSSSPIGEASGGVPVSQLVLQDLAGGVLGEGVHELEALGDPVGG